jgi:TPP-dependent 2-oxoacid decarboxylase
MQHVPRVRRLPLMHSCTKPKVSGGTAELMNAAAYPVATMVNAKGMVDEQHQCYIGT